LLKFSVEFSTIQQFNSLGNTLTVSINVQGLFDNNNYFILKELELYSKKIQTWIVVFS